MRFLPQHDLEAATERIEQAEALFRITHDSIAIDTAGRAVECLLRADYFRKYGATVSRLRAERRRKNLHRGVKGDFLNLNAQHAVEAARRIVDEGVKRWRRSKRN